jgi:hypothetical protein
VISHQLSTGIFETVACQLIRYTLFIMSVKHNYILLITPDTGCLLLTTCFGHSSTIIRSIRASVFTYIPCIGVYLCNVMGSHQFYNVCILDIFGTVVCQLVRYNSQQALFKSTNKIDANLNDGIMNSLSPCICTFHSIVLVYPNKKCKK